MMLKRVPKHFSMCCDPDGGAHDLNRAPVSGWRSLPAEQHADLGAPGREGLAPENPARGELFVRHS